ncbi:MAG: hypothetical protein AB1776_05300 [Bacillota bacterium]
MLRWPRLLVRLLLLPILPLLGWGPITHPLINLKALTRARDEARRGGKINRTVLDIVTRYKRAYVFGGNSADIVAAHHIATGSSFYDYTHNNLPDLPSGLPQFGYTLLDTWRRAAEGEAGGPYPEEEFAVACGWLAHQLADWYAHYAAVDREGRLLDNPTVTGNGVTVFNGYSNAHRVLGAAFYPEILEVYNLTDHALLELFYDLLIVGNDETHVFDAPDVALFRTRRGGEGARNLLTSATERYLGRAARIPPELVEELGADYRQVVRGMRVLLEFLLFLRPSLPGTLAATFGPGQGTPDYLDLAAKRVVDGLFRKDFQEIARLAAQPEAAAAIPPAAAGARAGTVLFQIARRLGPLLDPQVWVPVLRDPDSLNLKLFWGAFDLRARAAREIACLFVRAKLKSVLGEDMAAGAVLAFLAEMLAGDHENLDEPRRRFRRHLRPVITLEAEAGVSEAERVLAMLRRHELRVRITPAVIPGDALSRQEKGLLPETLCFRVDGYDAAFLPAVFTLEHLWDGDRLILVCRLNRELEPGRHHLFVSVRDAAGIAARPLDVGFELV